MTILELADSWIACRTILQSFYA